MDLSEFASKKRYRCFVIRFKSSDLYNYGNQLNFKSPEEVLLAVARATALSIASDKISNAALSVRFKPSPVLAILGSFDRMDDARIAAQSSGIIQACKNISYKTYKQIENDCADLADLLIQKFGREELKQYHFTALPRGGIIVLGLLSYFLDLKPDQLATPHPSDIPLVVIDDCALSGFRFGKFLVSNENQQVIFAHLYSHPTLRAVIVMQEPRVLACLAVHDLYDHASENVNEDINGWRNRWASRLNTPRYWIGQPDTICFPWNEPDRYVWNPATGQVETGWRILPPERCIKNHLPPGRQPVSIQIQSDGKGPIRPASRIVFGEIENQILIGELDTGNTFGLSDVAADIWRAIIEYGDVESVFAKLLQEYAVDQSVLRKDLNSFIGSLINRGILEIQKE